jgi:hypothetical protein
MKREPSVRLEVRLPASLYRRLGELAEREDRSPNRQARWMLSELLAANRPNREKA